MVMNLFITSSPNLPGTALCHSHVSCHWLPRSGDWHLPLHSPPQEVAESNEVASQPYFLQASQSKCPQPLLIGPSSPFTSFVAILWMLSNILTALLHCEALICTGIQCKVAAMLNIAGELLLLTGWLR